MKDVTTETENNRRIESRARLAIALKDFCKAFSEDEPCLNYQDCDECDIERRIKELKEEVMWAF